MRPTWSIGMTEAAWAMPATGAGFEGAPRETYQKMRYLLATVVTIVTGFVGGILGWWAGVAMDRFRWLGLGPEEFWHTDPENVWAWGFIIGGSIGMAVSLTASAWVFQRGHRP